jgi:ABC-2 type transport system permease protein
MLIAAFIGLSLSFVGFVTLAALHGRPQADDATIALFCFLVAAWSVVPILTFSSDDLVDPAKLALLPLSRRQVLVVHGVGAVVGIAPVATLVALTGAVVGTSSGVGSAVVGIVVVLLELALCVALSRTVVAALSRLLRSRRGRDLGVALTALVAISVQLLNPVLQQVSRSTHATEQLHSLASALRWLPPGLLASAPRAARDGRWLAVLWHVLAAVAFLGLLLWLWERSLRRAEEVPDATTGRGSRGSALLPRALSRLVPAGRAGAIAGKDLRYLSREPRRLVQVVTSAIFPAIFVVISPALSGGHLRHGMVFAVCGIGLFFGLQGANRFGQEGTASWALVAAGLELRLARRDLIGGDIAAALVGVPLVLVASGVLGALTGGWDLVPVAASLALAVMGVSFGGGALLSVLAPFPVPEGPRNAFSNGGGGQGVAAGLLGLAVMIGVVLTCLPLVVLLLPALHGHRVWLIVLVAPVYGLLIGSGLREVAARQWSLHGPEVLLKVNAQR